MGINDHFVFFFIVLMPVYTLYLAIFCVSRTILNVRYKYKIISHFLSSNFIWQHELNLISNLWIVIFMKCVVCPFSAVKCNDDVAVLRLLADLGTNFDCASKVCLPVCCIALELFNETVFGLNILYFISLYTTYAS